MRYKDRELMAKIRDFVDDCFWQNQGYPSLSVIGREFETNRTTAYRYLVEMDQLGILTNQDGKISIPKEQEWNADYVTTPLQDLQRFKSPDLLEKDVERVVRLPESVFGKGGFCLVRVPDDSMEDERIREEDLILVEAQAECCVGDIILARDRNGANTVRRYAGTEDKT